MLRVVLLGIGCLVLAGCGKAPGSDRLFKLEQVRAAAVAQASAEDLPFFQQATLVTELEGLPTEGVGLRVPIHGSSNVVFVLFAPDYFDARNIETLAAEAVADYARSKPPREKPD